MTEAVEEEVRSAALALLDLKAVVPRSGTVMHRGRLKTTFLIEATDGYFVVSRYACADAGRIACAKAAAGLDAAARAGLGPEPLHPSASRIIESSGYWWNGYAYMHGQTLWDRRSLGEIYYVLGTFAAAWHRLAKGDEPREDLGSRFRRPVLDPTISAQAESIFAQLPRRVFLHGDLNASNIVMTPDPKAIDFDEGGTGPAELDLAITLGYVNTSANDLCTCFDALLRGYSDGSGSADRNAVARLASLIPWYMLASECAPPNDRRSGTGSTNLAALQSSRIADALAPCC